MPAAKGNPDAAIVVTLSNLENIVAMQADHGQSRALLRFRC
jgi:hypothetical protein